jgi:diguanylate cyclase (GGDEF)-like protein/PAS domain S-box-containing protein
MTKKTHAKLAAKDTQAGARVPRILYLNTTGNTCLTTPQILVRAGYEVQELAGADEVLRHIEIDELRQARLLPDLILLDAEPQDVKGLEICVRVKGNPLTAHVPLVYVSELEATPRQRVKALEQGADSFLTRPLAAAELLAMVRALLRLKASEAELRRSNAYLDRIFDGASGPILVWDEHRVFTRVNHAAETLVGRAGEELVGRPVADLFHTPELGQAFISCAEGLGEKHRVPFEYDLIHADGSRRTILWNASTLIAINGTTPVATIAQGLDVTERKRDEARLRIAAIAFDCQEGLSVTDDQGVILQVNRAFSEITGFSADDVIGKTHKVLSARRHDADFHKTVWDSIRRTGAWQGESWNRRKNGEPYTEWLTISAVKTPAGVVTHYVGTHADISQRKSAEQEIRSLAFFDQLTGLPNRRLLRDRLERAQATSTRSGREGAVLFIDLDHFKTLNDTHGHDRGDLLLQQVAQRLVLCVREGDTVARQGGDEFVVILVELGQQPLDAAAQAEEVGRKILASVNGTYWLDGVEYHTGVSIGATVFSNHNQSIEQLLKQADLAMYRVKTSGRNDLHFFDPSMQAAVDNRSALERELRAGLQAGQFLLFYQGQVNLAGQLVGVEALLRWQHPARGLILPTEFIPLAEETGLIVPLGNWVLNTACTQLMIWAGQPHMAHVTMALNVSAREFQQEDFVAQVLAVLERTGVDPKNLKMEMTESVMMHDINDVIRKMNALRDRGICFALDDFGTGYSSLSVLKRLPLDRLKIDQSFVAHILTSSDDAAIATMILAMARSLGMSVIAEGVETQGQRDFLAAAGCRNFQGFLFGHPEPVELLA